MSKTVPDLRHTPEITLEHCSVLLEKISQALELIEGTEGYGIEEMDVTPLLHHFEELFEPEAFQKLFMEKSGFGKGILVGTFMTRLLSQVEAEDSDEEVHY